MNLKSILGGSAVGCAVLFAASAAGPRGPRFFFLYPTGCYATVVGEIEAWADVQGYDFFVYDSNTTDLSRRFAIPSGQALRFRGGGSAGVSVRGEGRHGCYAYAEAGNDGKLEYSYRGDDTTMRATFESGRTHKNLIRRDNGREPSVVLAESSWAMPSYDTVTMQVPFHVAGGNGGVIVIDQFAVRRADSGDTYGSTASTWTIYEDIDGNCAIDRGDSVLNSGSLVAYPNTSVSADPIRFAADRGNYILVVTYDTLSYLATYSTECGETLEESSTVQDVVLLELSLH